ncbi:MAG: MotA/TolQ/ExbB proton channel family protein [Planctomycetes bacterium]|nr:MotA/TolQ/ExbB proton channel family protein [Planctomycetota bacterium]
MKDHRPSNGFARIAGAIGWPVLIGLAACSLFFAAIFRGPLDIPLMHRYFAGHPVSICETAFFFVGLAALALKLVEVALQATLIGELPFEPAAGAVGTAHSDPIDAAPPAESARRLLDQLDAAGERVRESALGNRIRQAVRYVAKSGSPQGLEEELKYLADQDQDSQHESYALVRIVIWAIPMLGFLGTVMGIAQSLGGLDPQQLATNPSEAMQGLLAGLYVAFDTTAIALMMSIGLMFLQFPIDRVELQLLAQVTSRASDLLIGRFPAGALDLDPHLASIERMCYAVMRSVDGIVERQAEVWRKSLGQMQEQWHGGWDEGSDALRRALSASLDETLSSHAEELRRIEDQASRSAAERWERWQGRLDASTEALHAQQQAFERQGELMCRAIEVTGDVVRLEKSLNENLEHLAGARHFEDTVMSLSAAIQLLSTRLPPAPEARRVELRPTASQQERAA